MAATASPRGKPWVHPNLTKIKGTTFVVPLLFLCQAKEPVGRNIIKFTEGDDVSDGDFVYANFILTVLLLRGIQDFRNIHLAVSLFETNLSQIFSDIHLSTPIPSLSVSYI